VQGRNPHLLAAVMEINDDRRRLIVDRVAELVGELHGATIGLLGLAFKPNTDDIRDAPALSIARLLEERGAKVRAYDPVAMEGTARLAPSIEMKPDPYALAEGCQALIVCTEWNEFRNLDLPRLRKAMRAPNIVDGRNIYDAGEMHQAGFHYRGVGRGYNGALESQPAGAAAAPGEKRR